MPSMSAHWARDATPRHARSGWPCSISSATKSIACMARSGWTSAAVRRPRSRCRSSPRSSRFATASPCCRRSPPRPPSKPDASAASAFLEDDGRELRRTVLALLADAHRYPPGNPAIGLGDFAVGLGDHRGAAAVGLLANPDVERQPTRVLHPVFGSHLLPAAGAEDMLRVATVRTDVDRHVLDDAEDRDTDLLEHLEALARVEQRDVLGRRHDDRAGNGNLLREGEVDVARPGRHVDDQVVEI